MENTIYELDWIENNSLKESTDMENEVFSMYMKIMNQDIIPLLGGAKLE